MRESSIFAIERQLLSKCIKNTVSLIHATTVMDAIKRLTKAYDILSLNESLERSYGKLIKDCFFWDMASLQDLKLVKGELVVYHQTDFDPQKLLRGYDRDLESLIRNVTFRYNEL